MKWNQPPLTNMFAGTVLVLAFLAMVLGILYYEAEQDNQQTVCNTAGGYFVRQRGGEYVCVAPLLKEGEALA